jgi:hypothetical protein
LVSKTNPSSGGTSDPGVPCGAEERVKLVRELADHLQQLLAGKEVVTERLCPPQDSLVVDVEFQEALVAVFPNAIHSMAQLARWLEALEWAGQYHVDDRELHTSLRTIPETLAAYQRHMEAIQEMRDVCRSLKEATASTA